jgi:hypothetical protein
MRFAFLSNHPGRGRSRRPAGRSWPTPGRHWAVPGHPPFFLKPQPRFVTMRGGEYLFQPSISALRALAAA